MYDIQSLGKCPRCRQITPTKAGFCQPCSALFWPERLGDGEAAERIGMIETAKMDIVLGARLDKAEEC